MSKLLGTLFGLNLGGMNVDKFMLENNKKIYNKVHVEWLLSYCRLRVIIFAFVFCRCLSHIEARHQPYQ